MIWRRGNGGLKVAALTFVLAILVHAAAAEAEVKRNQHDHHHQTSHSHELDAHHHEAAGSAVSTKDSFKCCVCLTDELAPRQCTVGTARGAFFRPSIPCATVCSNVSNKLRSATKFLPPGRNTLNTVCSTYRDPVVGAVPTCGSLALTFATEDVAPEPAEVLAFDGAKDAATNLAEFALTDTTDITTPLPDTFPLGDVTAIATGLATLQPLNSDDHTSLTAVYDAVRKCFASADLSRDTSLNDLGWKGFGRMECILLEVRKSSVGSTVDLSEVLNNYRHESTPTPATTAYKAVADALYALIQAGCKQSWKLTYSMSFNIDPAYTAEAYTTAWGSPVTYAFEREGRSENIAYLYSPPLQQTYMAVAYDTATSTWVKKPAIMLTGDMWNRMSREAKRALMVANDLRYGLLDEKSPTKAWKGLTLLGWADLPASTQYFLAVVIVGDGKQRAGTVAYDRLKTELTSEVGDEKYAYPAESPTLSFSKIVQDEIARASTRVWEIPHKSYDSDLNVIFAAASVLSSEYLGGEMPLNGGADGDDSLLQKQYYDSLDISLAQSSMQFHLVFERPPDPSPAVWGPKMALFAYTLNLRSTLYSYEYIVPESASTWGPVLQALPQWPAFPAPTVCAPNAVCKVIGNKFCDGRNGISNPGNKLPYDYFSGITAASNSGETLKTLLSTNSNGAAGGVVFMQKKSLRRSHHSSTPAVLSPEDTGLVVSSNPVIPSPPLPPLAPPAPLLPIGQAGIPQVLGGAPGLFPGGGVFTVPVLRKSMPVQCVTTIEPLIATAESVEKAFDFVKNMPKNIHSKYLGPYDEAQLDALGTILAQKDIGKDDIEVKDSSGHQIGFWKFGVNSIRHTYAGNRIGFEFRSSTDDTIGTLLPHIAQTLRDWATFASPEASDTTMTGFRLDSDNNPYDVTLSNSFHISLNAYDIAGTVPPVAYTAATDCLHREQLQTCTDIAPLVSGLQIDDATKAMFKVVFDCTRTNDCVGDLPWDYDGNAGAHMLRRWSLLYIAWEAHPAVLANCDRNDDGPAAWRSSAAIRAARQKAVDKLAAVDTLANATPKQKMYFVSRKVADFIKDLWKCF